MRTKDQAEEPAPRGRPVTGTLLWAVVGGLLGCLALPGDRDGDGDGDPGPVPRCALAPGTPEIEPPPEDPSPIGPLPGQQNANLPPATLPPAILPPAMLPPTTRAWRSVPGVGRRRALALAREYWRAGTAFEPETVPGVGPVTGAAVRRFLERPP